MNRRRYFLKGIGTGIASLSFPVFASAAWPLQSATGKNSLWPASNGRSAGFCKVIGIGAGTSIVLAMRSMLAFDGFSKMPELICVDFGTEHLRRIAAACEAAPEMAPVKAISLAPSASGWVNRARVLALRQREVLKDLLAGADMVVLVAGLGGSTGSGVTPIMARLAREAGALTVAAVVRPFAFEEGLNPLAGNALRYLRRESDVVEFSNEEWAKHHGDDALLKEIIASHDRHIAGCIRDLIDRSICTGPERG